MQHPKNATSPFFAELCALCETHGVNLNDAVVAFDGDHRRYRVTVRTGTYLYGPANDRVGYRSTGQVDYDTRVPIHESSE